MNDLWALGGCALAIFLATRREFWFLLGWAGIVGCFIAGLNSLFALHLWGVIGFYFLALPFGLIAAAAEEKINQARAITRTS